MAEAKSVRGWPAGHAGRAEDSGDLPVGDGVEDVLRAGGYILWRGNIQP